MKASKSGQNVATASKTADASASKAEAAAEPGPEALALAPPAYGIDHIDFGSPPDAGQGGSGGGLSLTRPHGSSRPGGRPLPSGVRSHMEAMFSTTFSDVRYHVGERAMLDAAAHDAHAYTLGSDIVLGDSRFDPSSLAGRDLLSHELAHVVQQRSPSSPSSTAFAEADADRAALAIRQGRPASVRASFGAQIQRKEKDEPPTPKLRVETDGTVYVKDIAAFKVTPTSGGTLESKPKVGGGYVRLKGKEFARAGNSVSWQFAITVTTTEPANVTALPGLGTHLQNMLPSVQIVAGVKVVPEAAPPPISPLKLSMARQILGQEDGPTDPNELVGPRADVALAETLEFTLIADPNFKPFDPSQINADWFRHDGSMNSDPNAIHWGGDVPHWAKDLRGRKGKYGEIELWSLDGTPVVRPDGSYLTVGPDGQPIERKSLFADTQAQQLEQNVIRPAIELAASGGKRTLADGRVLDEEQWKNYVWERHKAVQAEANRKLEDLSEGVRLWNEAQQGVAKLAAVPSHLLGGRSLDDGNKILAETVQNVEIALNQITKARTPTQLTLAEQAVKSAIRRGESKFFGYKEDVFAGGERTVTGVKVVAVAAVAYVAAPALFAWAGGAATAGVGTNLLATGLSSVGSGMLTGSLGGLLESVDRGFTMANYGKGFTEHFMTGFTAGLNAGGSVILKLNGPMTWGNLGKTAGLNAGIGGIQGGTNQAIRNATDLDPSAANDPKRSVWGAALREALMGGFTGVLGTSTAGVPSTKLGNFATQAGFDAALNGTIVAIEGGSQEDILAAVLQSGVSGVVRSGLGAADKRFGGRIGGGKKPATQDGAGEGQQVSKPSDDKAASGDLANQPAGMAAPGRGPAPGHAPTPAVGTGPKPPRPQPPPPRRGVAGGQPEPLEADNLTKAQQAYFDDWAKRAGPHDAERLQFMRDKTIRENLGEKTRFNNIRDWQKAGRPLVSAPTPAAGPGPAPGASGAAPAHGPGAAPGAPGAAPAPAPGPAPAGPPNGGPPRRAVLPNGTEEPFGSRGHLTQKQHEYFEAWQKQAAGNPAELELLRFTRANTIRENLGKPPFADVDAWRAGAAQDRAERRADRNPPAAAPNPTPQKPSIKQRVKDWWRGAPPERRADGDRDEMVGSRRGLTKDQAEHFRKRRQQAAGDPAEMERVRFDQTNTARRNLGLPPFPDIPTWRSSTSGLPSRRQRQRESRRASMLVTHMMNRASGTGKIDVHGDPQFVAAVRRDLEVIARTPVGRQLLEELRLYGFDVEIHPPSSTMGPGADPQLASYPFANYGPYAINRNSGARPIYAPLPGAPLRTLGPVQGPGGVNIPAGSQVSLVTGGSGSGSAVVVDPLMTTGQHYISRGLPSDVILAHELNHARNNARGLKQNEVIVDMPDWQRQWTNMEEYNTVDFENAYRGQRGGTSFRYNYDHTPTGQAPRKRWWQR